jgi:hypothetical protein
MLRSRHVLFFIILLFITFPVLAMPGHSSAPPVFHHHKKSHPKRLAHQKIHKKHPKKIAHFTHPLPVNFPTAIPAYALSSSEKKLISFMQQTFSSLHYSTYRLGGSHIDPAHGIYVVDCSMFIDHVLKSLYPHAYAYLTNWSGTDKPTTDDFYHYFRSLETNDQAHWSPIEDASQLRPGDVLVIRYKNARGQESGGHVMMVMDEPWTEQNILAVRVADSAAGRHSLDTRSLHTSGIGSGVLLLKLDPHTALPDAYAWRIGSHWQTRAVFAMARPIEFI